MSTAHKCRPWHIFKRLPYPYERWAKDPDDREFAPLWYPRKGPPLRLSEMTNGHFVNANEMCRRNPARLGHLLSDFEFERARRWPNAEPRGPYRDGRKQPLFHWIEHWAKEKQLVEPKRSWWSRLWGAR